MFTSDLAESKQDKVSLYDVDPDAVEALIDYAYSNKVSISTIIHIFAVCYCSVSCFKCDNRQVGYD